MQLLPDEIVVHTLQYALTRIDSKLQETLEALFFRETCLRFKQLIERYLLTPVTHLCPVRVTPKLTGRQLCLFKGLHTLQLDYEIELKDSTLSQMTWLKKLLLRSKALSITHSSLSVLTNLTALELFKPNAFQSVGLAYLTQLHDLRLTCNTVVTDWHISNLRCLHSVHLDNDSAITGTGFTSHLESLRISGSVSRLSESTMWRLTTQLTTLKMTRDQGVPPHQVLQQMTKLTKLCINYNGRINDYVLSTLTALHTLELVDVPLVTDQTLSRLSQLTSLALCSRGGRNRSPAGIAHLQGTLKIVMLVEQNNFTLQDFMPYTALQSLSYHPGNFLKPDTTSAELLRARGISVKL